MRNYQIGDVIGYDTKTKKYGYIYGRIDEISDNKALWVNWFDTDYDKYSISAQKADYIEPVIIDEEAASKFARYELSFAELAGGIVPPQRIRLREKHTLTAEELLCTLKKASGLSVLQFKKEWFTPIFNYLCDSFDFGCCDLYDEATDGVRFLPSIDSYIWDAMDTLAYYVYNGFDDYSDIINDLTNAARLCSLPVEKREYPDEVKSYYIRRLYEDDLIERASDREAALYRKYADELCLKGDKNALRAKAYGAYGGNTAYPCDWTMSRDALIALMEIDDDPFLANTLGYIYYYGRCNDGEPEYDKAFKYYCIGAAGGVYESRYKLADMFAKGLGTPKNARVASDIIGELYHQNLKYILKNELNCKFADVALRMGNLFRDGNGCDVDFDDAYYYYLQADFAIRMRMLEGNHYGDRKVAEGIHKTIAELLPETSFRKPHKSGIKYNLYYVLHGTYEKHHKVELKIKKTADGEYSLKFRILPRADEKYPPKMFITAPDAHFCGLLETLSVKTKGVYWFKVDGKDFTNDSATVVFDSFDCESLYLYGKKVATISCEYYKLTLPSTKDSKKVHFASVIFTPGQRHYDFICELADVAVGDKVIVATAQGEAEVEVVGVFDKTASETALPISKYKKIIRKA